MVLIKKLAAAVCLLSVAGCAADIPTEEAVITSSEYTTAIASEKNKPACCRNRKRAHDKRTV